MAELREFLVKMEEMRQKIQPGVKSLQGFMLEHGQEFEIDAFTYKGKRMKARHCFMNAARMALNNRELIYVEGQLGICGIGIDHAWVVGPNGKVIDPTIKPGKEPYEYFGIPFKHEYLIDALLRNRVYGLLGWPGIKHLIGEKAEVFLKKLA